MGIEELQNVVLQRQKILGEIFRTKGELSVAAYAGQWTVAALPPSRDAAALLRHIERMYAELYGTGLAREAVSELAQKPLVSTIDHLGIFGHPFFLNSNLVFSLRPGRRFLTGFATAGVSLNNSSWPACVLLREPGSHNLARLSLFPDAQKTRAVLSAAGFVRADAERVIAKARQLSFLDGSRQERLAALLERLLLAEDILAEARFQNQACKISARLWAELFPNAPRLLYLPLEELVSRLIAEEIAIRPNHDLYRLLFTEGGWQAVERHFRGSMGAFSSVHKGSFLFWGMRENGRRAHLARQGNTLTDQGFSVPLTPEAVSRGLAGGWLYPTSLVSFIVLMYYGLTSLGGFNQVNWLSDFKGKFIALLREQGGSALADRVRNIPTNNFAESSVAFVSDGRGRLYKPTAWDIWLDGGSGAYNNFGKLAEIITVKQSILSELPEIYKIITPAEERNPKLTAISQEEIDNYIGLGAAVQSVPALNMKNGQGHARMV